MGSGLSQSPCRFSRRRLALTGSLAGARGDLSCPPAAKAQGPYARGHRLEPDPAVSRPWPGTAPLANGAVPVLALYRLGQSIARLRPPQAYEYVAQPMLDEMNSRTFWLFVITSGDWLRVMSMSRFPYAR